MFSHAISVEWRCLFLSAGGLLALGQPAQGLEIQVGGAEDVALGGDTKENKVGRAEFGQSYGCLAGQDVSHILCSVEKSEYPVACVAGAVAYCAYHVWDVNSPDYELSDCIGSQFF